MYSIEIGVILTGLVLGTLRWQLKPVSTTSCQLSHLYPCTSECAGTLATQPGAMEGGALESLGTTASLGYTTTAVKVREHYQRRSFAADPCGNYSSIWPVMLF